MWKQRHTCSVNTVSCWHILRLFGRKISTWSVSFPQNLLQNVITELRCDHCVRFVLFQLNHLSGLRQKFIKLSFWNTTDLVKVKKELMPIVRRNRERNKHANPLTDMQLNSYGGLETDYGSDFRADPSEHLIDIRSEIQKFFLR